MRKKSVKLILCAVLVFAMLALAACGGKDGKDSTTQPESGTTTGDDASKDADSDADSKADAPEDSNADEPDDTTSGDDAEAPESNGSGTYASMEEFANSEELKSQLESLKSTVSAQGMDLTITGEGNKLTYIFTYQEVANQEGMADQLASALDAQKATYETLASQLETEIGIDGVIVAVQYVDCNGELIYEAEFSAQ